MAKVHELSESERLAIKNLCLIRHSYTEIGRKIGFSESAIFRVFKKFELAGSVEKRRRCGHPKYWRRDETKLSAELLDN